MSNKPLRIGITGGIGSGKSTVAQMFELLHVPVYNADNRAKWLMEHDSLLQQSIIADFGSEAYVQGKLNRQFLAQKVFVSDNLVQKLNALVHPAVAIDFDKWCSQINASYVLKEAALLFETKSYQQLDATILVLSPLSLRVERIKKRDPQRSLQQIEAIIEKQIAVEKAKSLADYIINNDESNLLIPQVLTLHQALIKRANHDIS